MPAFAWESDLVFHLCFMQMCRLRRRQIRGQGDLQQLQVLLSWPPWVTGTGMWLKLSQGDPTSWELDRGPQMVLGESEDSAAE